MFEWFGVWSKIKGELKGCATSQAYKLMAKLKALKASTTSDLAELIADSNTFRSMDIPKAWTLDRILDTNDPDAKIEFHSIPVSYISTSPVLVASLADKLKSNVELGAARNTLGVSDQDWSNFLASYAKLFVKYATPIALTKLADASTKIYVDELVLAIAKGEAYTLDGMAGYHDMVKLFRIPNYADQRAEIRRARRLWKRRLDITYQRNV